MNLSINKTGDIRILIDGSECDPETISDGGFHSFRAEEISGLTSDRWWIELLNPMKFFGFAFFKDSFYLRRAYNSLAAALEFDMKVLSDRASVNLKLETERGRGGYVNNYHSIRLTDSSGVYVKNVRKALPAKKVRFRWILLRTIPPFILATAFFLVGIINGKSLAIPLVYSLALILHFVLLINNKPVLD